MSLVCYWTCSLLTSLDCELALVLVYYSTCFLFALFGQVSFSFGLLYDPLSLSLGWSRVGFSFGMLFDLLSFSLVRLWVGFRFGLLSTFSLLASLNLESAWIMVFLSTRLMRLDLYRVGIRLTCMLNNASLLWSWPESRKYNLLPNPKKL